MEFTKVNEGQLAEPAAIPQHALKGKHGSCPGVSQRRATPGGGHSTRRSQPGHPISLNAAVTPSCPLAPPAGAATAAFSHSTPDQDRERLASLVMDRQQHHLQQQHSQQQLHPLPAAPPCTPATATAAAAAAAAAADDDCMLAAAAEEPSMSDLEDLFAEAEGVVDTFMRHPSNPNAAKLFGADVSDALARLASTNTPPAPAPAPAGLVQQLPRNSKPSFLSSLGLGRPFGIGPGSNGPSYSQLQAAAAAAAAYTAEVDTAGPCHLIGTKRSKPSFTLSRDPAADRPSSRRELDCSSNGVTSDPIAAAATAVVVGRDPTAAAVKTSEGLAAAPTPPPSATSSSAAEAAAGPVGFSLSRRKWGLDLSDSGMVTARPSPFAASGHQSAAAAAGWAGQPSSHSSSHGSRHPRASMQGLAVSKAAFKPHQGGIGGKGSGTSAAAAARRSSCPGMYLAGLMLTSGEVEGAAFAHGRGMDTAAGLIGDPAAAAAAAAGVTEELTGVTSSGALRVLDLSSPRSKPQGMDGVADVSMSPFAISPGTASSSALAAAAAAAAAAGDMLASDAFDSAAAAAGTGSISSMAMSEDPSTDKCCSSSLQSKRSVGGAATVNKTPRQAAAAAAAGVTESPPAVFMTITSSSGQGPTLSRKVSSRSVGSPQSGEALAAAAAAAASVDMAVDSESLSAACAAAMAAVAAEAAAGSSAHSHGHYPHPHQQQQQQQVDGQCSDMPRLRPIRTKSRTEGPAAILNPSATGTAALEAAAFAPAARTASAARSSSLNEVIAQQQMLLLQHQQQQQQRMDSGNMQAGIFGAVQDGGCMQQQQMQQQGMGSAQLPKTPAVTPATTHAAAAANMQASSTGELLAAAAANITAACAVPGPGVDSAARVSFSGTPSGIASSIAQMTLQSPVQMGLALAQPNYALPGAPAAAPQAPAAAAAGGPGQQQQQQQVPVLPWQHLPASACNGVAVFSGDSGLVFVAGQQVTTGLIKPAAQPANNQGSCYGPSSSSSGSYNASQWFAGQAAGPPLPGPTAAYIPLPDPAVFGLFQCPLLPGPPVSSAMLSDPPVSGRTQGQQLPGPPLAGLPLLPGPPLAGPVAGPGMGYMMRPHSTGTQSATAWGMTNDMTHQMGGAAGVQGPAGYGLAASNMQPGYCAGAGVSAGVGAVMAGVSAAQQAARRMSAPQIPPFANVAVGASMLWPRAGGGYTAQGAQAAAAAAAAGASANSMGFTMQAFPGLQALQNPMQGPAGAVTGADPAEATLPGGVFSGFGGPEDMQEELNSQQLQDLMAGSAIMRFPGSDVFGSFICHQ